jgi:putative intracellular protease/amidase
MNIKSIVAGLLIASAASGSMGASPTPRSRGKVLVIISSENQMKLKDSGIYHTGYYLNELTVPVKALVDEGYVITFANPKGNTPAMDVHSDSASFFGNDPVQYQKYKNFRESLTGLKKPLRLADVIRDGLGQYDGVFFPGGHAPMIDLLESRDVRTVLEYFHAESKPTALICHGPISLLAALPNSKEVVTALRAGNQATARDLAHNWIYTGYQMTIFSTPEEQYAESNQLGGKVLFYPDEALRVAGASVEVAPLWQSNVRRDRELITGQNPGSDEELAKQFINALEKKSPNENGGK